MTPRGLRSGARRIAAAKSATLDLFEDRRPTVARPTEAASAAAVLRSSTTPQPGVRPRPRQLWYAAVFSELPESLRPVHQTSSLLQRLCLSAQRFTSLVSIEMPDALLMEIQGSVKLFGSLAVLQARIDAAWRRLSLRALGATAPTPLAALWLARAGRQVSIEDPGLLAGALAPLPIACTSWDAEWLHTLRAMGVTRIGELLRLPRSGVSRRLSPAAVLDLDIALARQAAPRRAFVPRQRFRDRCDFETEIETVAYLQKALEPLLERCARFLRERQAGVQALELKLRHRVLPITRVRVGLANITGDRGRLTEVLEEKLGRLELPAPVRGMELTSGSLQPLTADSLDVFAGLHGGGGRAPDTAPHLVERLRARFGEHAVYGVRSVAEHRPEAAWQRVQELCLTSVSGMRLGGVRATGVRATGVRATGMPRPIWLLDAPVPLPADPRQSPRGGLVLDQGPERLESGWWDGKGVARDYYIAHPSHGARWWVFQERQTKRWYLHGVFA